MPVPFGGGRAGQPLVLLGAAGEIARRVAFAAMARPFDEIAAEPRPVPARPSASAITGWSLEIEQLPQAEAAPDVERKAEPVARRLAGDRRQRLHEGVEVGDVGRLHARIGRVGKGRIVVRAARRNAVQHGVGEILERPGADAVLRIGRDVRARRTCRTASSARGRRPARSCAAPFGFRPRVTGRAAAGIENALAARRHRLPRARRLSAASSAFGHRSGTRTPPRRPPPRTSAATASFPMQTPSGRGTSLLDAIGLVAAAAICADRRRAARFSASTSWAGAATAAAGSALNLSTAALKPGHVFPDFRGGLGVALVAARREQRVDIDLLRRWRCSACSAASTAAASNGVSPFDHLGKPADQACRAPS